jgi:hypothetical protein
MASPENELLLDFSGVSQNERLKILAIVKKAGAKVLNEDIVPFIDSAPPEPISDRLTFDLERELATRAPFTLIIRRYHMGSSVKAHFTPEYKQALIEKVSPLGVKELGLTSGLRALCSMEDSRRSPDSTANKTAN